MLRKFFQPRAGSLKDDTEIGKQVQNKYTVIYQVVLLLTSQEMGLFEVYICYRQSM